MMIDAMEAEETLGIVADHLLQISEPPVIPAALGPAARSHIRVYTARCLHLKCCSLPHHMAAGRRAAQGALDLRRHAAGILCCLATELERARVLQGRWELLHPCLSPAYCRMATAAPASATLTTPDGETAVKYTQLSSILGQLPSAVWGTSMNFGLRRSAWPSALLLRSLAAAVAVSGSSAGARSLAVPAAQSSEQS